MSNASAIARGTGGTLRIGGLKAGRFTSWHVVISPTTGKPTLFGEGAFVRFYAGAKEARAYLFPDATPARIGRPSPPKPQAFVLAGVVREYTGRSIVIAEGEIIRP